jgi:hypothetical protein
MPSKRQPIESKPKIRFGSYEWYVVGRYLSELYLLCMADGFDGKNLAHELYNFSNDLTNCVLGKMSFSELKLCPKRDVFLLTVDEYNGLNIEFPESHCLQSGPLVEEEYVPDWTWPNETSTRQVAIVNWVDRDGNINRVSGAGIFAEKFAPDKYYPMIWISVHKGAYAIDMDSDWHKSPLFSTENFSLKELEAAIGAAEKKVAIAFNAEGEFHRGRWQNPAAIRFDDGTIIDASLLVRGDYAGSTPVGACFSFKGEIKDSKFFTGVLSTPTEVKITIEKGRVLKKDFKNYIESGEFQNGKLYFGEIEWIRSISSDGNSVRTVVDGKITKTERYIGGRKLFAERRADRAKNIPDEEYRNKLRKMAERDNINDYAVVCDGSCILLRYGDDEVRMMLHNNAKDDMSQTYRYLTVSPEDAEKVWFREMVKAVIGDEVWTESQPTA